MAEAKTKPSGESVSAYIAQLEDTQQRGDSEALVRMMARVTGKKPTVWAGSMIGFGSYHYRYESGREGDAFLVGFAPRKNELSIYLHGSHFPEQAKASNALLAKLGKHRMGKACLYVKRLDDIDLDVLEQLVRTSVEGLKAHYPTE